MTIANKASCNCTNLGIPSINMNLAEGSICMLCETQPPNNEGEIYLLIFQYSSFKNWHGCNKASSCSMSVTLKENMDREIECTQRCNLSSDETGILHTSTAKTTLARTMHPTTSKTPDKTYWLNWSIRLIRLKPYPHEFYISAINLPAHHS